MEKCKTAWQKGKYILFQISLVHGPSSAFYQASARYKTSVVIIFLLLMFLTYYGHSILFLYFISPIMIPSHCLSFADEYLSGNFDHEWFPVIYCVHLPTWTVAVDKWCCPWFSCWWWAICASPNEQCNLNRMPELSQQHLEQCDFSAA